MENALNLDTVKLAENKKEIFDLLDGHFETFRKRLEEN